MLCFLHIAKTGGTAFRIALAASTLAGKLMVLERDEDILRVPYDDYKPDSVVFGHLSWRLANFLGAEMRATVLREPISRCLSQMQQWFHQGRDYRETNDFSQNRWVIARDRDLWWNFEHLLDCTEMPQFRALSNAQAAQLADHHIHRQDVLDDRWLKLATEHLDQCSVVGISEALPAFAAKFPRLLGVTLEVGKHNAGTEPTGSLVERIPADLHKKLLRCNEMDIELYRLASEKAARPEPGTVAHLCLGEHLKRGMPRFHRPSGYEVFRGRFPLRLCHYMIDVAEIQHRLGVSGTAFLDRWMLPREAALMVDLAGIGATIWTGSDGPDPAIYADLAAIGPTMQDLRERSTVTNAFAFAPASNHEPFRLAFVQGQRAAGDLDDILRRIMPDVAPLGVIVIANAMTWSGSMHLPKIREIADANGICVAAIVNTHAVLCRREWAWLYGCLLRAKLGDREIVRSRHDSEEVLELDCDY
jgi:hypothetical protein